MDRVRVRHNASVPPPGETRCVGHDRNLARSVASAMTVM